MLSSPPASVLESYAKELQRSWLTGKAFPVWTIAHLRENFPSEQVVQFLLFQIENRALNAIHDTGFWDWRDGELLASLGEFFTSAQSKISIGHLHISPLLHAAIFHSLRLLTSPEESLTQFYFSQRSALTIKEFAFYSRYVIYFDFVPAALLSYAERNNLSVIDKSIWVSKFSRILSAYEEETQEKIEAYQRHNLEKMCQQPVELIQKRWAELRNSEQDVISSIFTEGHSGSDELMKNLFGTTPGEGAGSAAAERARNPLLSAIDYEPRRILMEQFQATTRRVETLRRFELESIPVHKQFVYIQRIFDGNPVAFRHAIEQLNNTTSPEEARKLIQTWRSDKVDAQALSEFEQWVVSRFQS
ncbi:MAG: hypothetical protein N2200_04085 [Bacteroidia bacterium]|nr:hypothetical protein [Bacteroidia bacterium]